MEYKDYYKIMGLSRDAGTEDIKRAYRKLARKYHPDVSKEPDAEEHFKEVQEAYEVLHDPDKRKAYDNMGRYQPGEEFQPPPGWDQGLDFEEVFTDIGAFSDFFESLFGRRRGGTGRTTHFRAAGQDQQARLRITLEEAYHGGTRTLNLSMPEPDDQGRIRQKHRELKVRIPAGIQEGQRIRLQGQGGSGIGGGRAGDLFLQVEYEPHRLFRADGRDIYLELPITPWEAALGGKVAVPTLTGKVNLTIPAGSQSGKPLRLKGKGLPGKTPGDQIVRLKIVTPPATTEEQRRLYEQMRDNMPMNPRQELGV